jgi:putative endonuclease
MYKVYILYSEKLHKHYVGYTDNISRRLSEHNRGKSKFTRIGIPWVLITSLDMNTRLEAARLEKRIKEIGIKRFLETQKQSSLK